MGFKLFGVQIDSPIANDYVESDINTNIEHEENSSKIEGCINLVSESNRYDRLSKFQQQKIGKAWSEEEHRQFLIGLEKRGKGDWKGIAKHFVPSRNPKQVASHAQKYFKRVASKIGKNRIRPSIFDISLPQTSNQPSEAVSGDSVSSNKAAGSSLQASIMSATVGANLQMLPHLGIAPYSATASTFTNREELLLPLPQSYHVLRGNLAPFVPQTPNPTTNLIIYVQNNFNL